MTTLINGNSWIDNSEYSYFELEKVREKNARRHHLYLTKTILIRKQISWFVDKKCRTSHKNLFHIILRWITSFITVFALHLHYTVITLYLYMFYFTDRQISLSKRIACLMWVANTVKSKQKTKAEATLHMTDKRNTFSEKL